MRMLKERHRLDREQKAIEYERDILEQQGEIDEARIEESVWEQEEVSGVVTDADGNNNSGALTNTAVYAADRPDAGGKQRNSGVNETSADDGQVNTATTSTRGCSVGSKYDTAACDTTARSTTQKDISTTVRDMVQKTQPVSVTSTEVRDSASGKYGVPVYDTHTNSIDSAFQRLADTLNEGFNLPKPELLTFNGNVTEYCKFIRNFETNIESKIHDDRLKLSYLIQYCTNEAKTCIEDCVLLEPSEGYQRARSILYYRYGKPHIVARSYVDKLVNGPPLKANDTNGLLQLALDMQKCEITHSKLGFASDTQNLRCMVKRLPMFLRVKWADIAQSIAEKGRKPRFTDLAKFVDERSQVASSVYGMDIAQGDVKVLKYNTGKRNAKRE